MNTGTQYLVSRLQRFAPLFSFVIILRAFPPPNDHDEGGLLILASLVSSRTSAGAAELDYLGVDDVTSSPTTVTRDGRRTDIRLRLLSERT